MYGKFRTDFSLKANVTYVFVKQLDLLDKMKDVFDNAMCRYICQFVPELNKSGFYKMLRTERTYLNTIIIGPFRNEMLRVIPHSDGTGFWHQATYTKMEDEWKDMGDKMMNYVGGWYSYRLDVMLDYCFCAMEKYRSANE